MRVQLFNPSIFWYSGLHYRMLPTLSLPILNAVINNAGHYCEAVDLEALEVHPDTLEAVFAQQKAHWPDVIGLTSLTITVKGCKASIKALRKAGFTGRIVVGGVHVTLDPQAGLDWGADLVVTGECEGNIVELLESGATGIQAGKPMDIKDLPAPDWTHHNPQPTTYTGNMRLLNQNPGITMWTRGCPFSCIFCGNTIFNHRPTRYRPPENIEAEMLDLKRRGCKNLFVYDDELIGTKIPAGWMKDVADRIEPMGFTWVTQGRCNKKFVTADLLKDAKRAGCKIILWGVESMSDKVLKAIKKHTTPEDVFHTLRLAKEAGIENGVFTMIGNYQETEEDLAITANALNQAYNEGLIQYRQTTVCTAMPGTEYAEIQQREGWYHEAPDTGMQMLQVNNPTPWLTSDQINKWMQIFNQACPVGMP